MSSNILAILALAFVSSLVGCGDDDDESPPPAVETTEAPAPAPPMDSSPIEAPDDALPEPRVRALLDAWLAAQNAGDFEAYSALYGDRFEGVKRAGERSYRYGRAQWLDDRRRMFQRPMQVSVEGVSIVSASAAAVVTFEQQWSSATFSDVGRKQLVVVVYRDELRIGREEMLSSRILNHGEVAAPDSADFMLVIDAGGPYAVLSVDPAIADAATDHGPLRLAKRSSPATVVRAVDPTSLDASIQSLVSSPIDVFGAEGPLCAATLGSPSVLRHVVPHFGTVQHWDGAFGDPPRTEEQIATDVWELGEGATLLVAPLLAESCTGALWARVHAEDPPTIYTPHPADDAQRARALSKFRGLRAYAGITRDYRSYGREYRGHWYEHGGATPDVFRWRERGGARELFTVRARAGIGCAEFSGALFSLFAPTESDLEVLTDERAPGDYEPRSIIDLDGDGMIEIVVEQGLLRTAAEGGFVRVLDARPPYFDCDC